MTADYPPNSRYHRTPTSEYVAPDGRRIVYLSPRLVPAPEQHVALARHDILVEERIDRLADRYYGDSEQYWRICDASTQTWPPDVVREPGSTIVIPLPLEVASRGDA
jgi:hypothetical protein